MRRANNGAAVLHQWTAAPLPHDVQAALARLRHADDVARVLRDLGGYRCDVDVTDVAPAVEAERERCLAIVAREVRESISDGATSTREILGAIRRAELAIREGV